ncbi:E3 ubiquitin-protein ligase ARI4 [Mizuhopecten yessoensis]|uniref:RBR-type E3 ubiquitin transferase n=2 Tax=Mizuhopecten yessoensis TaxID=6573 RepID=A0A210Q0B7_MIZYE|nr:E3 ubiquitin-protein ligase ARI4 [Mizuhopecten yessoensis]
MFMDMAMDECQDEFDYSENEDDDIDPDEDAYKPRPNTLCVGDILFHSNDMQELLCRELISSKSTDALRKQYNKHPPAEEREMENGATGGHSMTRPSLTTSIPRHITIFIPKTEVLTGHLQEVFGENYIECRCFPRKFVIDITEKVTSTILKFKAFQNRDMNIVELSAVLVFAYDMFGSLDSTDMDSFKVSINMKTTQSCLKLNTLPEKGVFGIEEIIQGAISYIATILCGNFVSKDIPSPKTIPAKTNHNILKLYTTEITSVSPENITIRDILKENRKKHDTSMVNVDFESLPPDTCSICFESILDSPATALQTCGHWFCDSCWNDHVITTAGCSTRRITCPEYKCQSTVDYDILLTTSNIQIVKKVFQRLIDKETDKEASSKWCPNKKCGRVIRYKNKEIGQIMNVTCECGTAFCFDCLQPVHWPLSCRDHDKYLEKLKEHGHIDKDAKTEKVFTFTVRGKRCPVCKTFIEKEGGCFTMSCICGTNFCWGCLKTCDSHPRTRCYKGDMYSTDGDNYRAKKEKIVQRINGCSNNDQPDWYKRAVMIRSWRNPSKVKVMSSTIRGMCRTLRSYKRRQDAGIGAELENFELPESHQHTCVTDKTHPFLTSMIGVYLEASLICEYTTVFLEMCKNQNITQIRDCLQRLTKEIHTILRDSNNVHLKSSFTRLFHLRIECVKVINKLFDTIE